MKNNHKTIIKLNLVLVIILISCAKSDIVHAQTKSSVEFPKSSQFLGNTRTFGMATSDVDMDGDFDVIMTHKERGNAIYINQTNLK